MLQLIEEVLAMLSAPELPQSQTTDNGHKHKANAEVLQSTMRGFGGSVSWFGTSILCACRILHIPMQRCWARSVLKEGISREGMLGPTM